MLGFRHRAGRYESSSLIHNIASGDDTQTPPLAPNTRPTPPGGKWDILGHLLTRTFRTRSKVAGQWKFRSRGRCGGEALRRRGRNWRTSFFVCVTLSSNGKESVDKMNIEPRISIITLGVADVGRAVRFYRDGLGWPSDVADGADWAIFRTVGTRFALYPRAKLARDISPEVNPGQRGFGGITLAHNVRSKEEVRAALAAAEAAGARILKPAREETQWGGYSGYFADLDGYPWEVAWGEMWTFAADGTLWGAGLGELGAR
jgi:catechol 2,3-dioxygenase-like lactoylglutathione lyase family enzyme